MKTRTLTQAQAEGYFINNRIPVVVEWCLPDEDQPVNISMASNGQNMKYLRFLKEALKFKNRSVTDLEYQAWLLENYDSRQRELGAGFIRFVPQGREQDVTLRVTECDSKTNARVIKKLYQDTKMPKHRAVRRDIPLGKNLYKGLRVVNPVDDLIVDAGTCSNVRVKVA